MICSADFTGSHVLPLAVSIAATSQRAQALQGVGSLITIRVMIRGSGDCGEQPERYTQTVVPQRPVRPLSRVPAGCRLPAYLAASRGAGVAGGLRCWWMERAMRGVATMAGSSQ